MWGAVYQSHLSKLVILQKRVVRVIHGVPPRTHTEPLFLELNVLKVNNLYKYSIALFMYKLNSSELSDIFPMFLHNYEIHDYETRQLKQFHIPMCHTNLTKMSIKYQGPLIRNDISSNVDVDCSIGTSKKRAKLYFAGDYVWVSHENWHRYLVFYMQSNWLCRLHGSYFCCCCDILYFLSKHSSYVRL